MSSNMSISEQLITAFAGLSLEDRLVAVTAGTIQRANDTIALRMALAKAISDDTTIKLLETLKTDVQRVEYAHRVPDWGKDHLEALASVSCLELERRSLRSIPSEIKYLINLKVLKLCGNEL